MFSFKASYIKLIRVLDIDEYIDHAGVQPALDGVSAGSALLTI